MKKILFLIVLIGNLSVSRHCYSMLSELKHFLKIEHNKKDLEFRMAGYLYSDFDRDRIKLRVPCDGTYVNCIHYALAKNVGLQESLVFQAGENECTSLDFENFYEQIPFSKAQNGELMLYVSSIDYLAIQHAAVLYDKEKQLADSQLGCLDKSIHAFSGLPFEYGSVIVFMRPKKGFSLARMAYDNEIACYNIYKNYENYKKKRILAERAYLCFTIKQYNNSFKMLDRDQRLRMLSTYQEVILSAQKDNVNPSNIYFMLLNLKKWILNGIVASNHNLNDFQVEEFALAIYEENNL